MLLQDVNFLDEMTHFDRERIPERVVHAKGAGAFGYLEITHDITKYTSAKVFEKVGKRTVSFGSFDKSKLTDKNFKFYTFISPWLRASRLLVCICYHPYQHVYTRQIFFTKL